MPVSRNTTPKFKGEGQRVQVLGEEAFTSPLLFQSRQVEPFLVVNARFHKILPLSFPETRCPPQFGVDLNSQHCDIRFRGFAYVQS